VEAGAEAALTSGDSYHALRVLRLGEGDYCEVVVGAAVYAAMVVRADDPVRVRFVKRLEGTEAGARYSREVGLVQA
jgi:16S rRNA U1498 N3-methylase RsmE